MMSLESALLFWATLYSL